MNRGLCAAASPLAAVVIARVRLSAAVNALIHIEKYRVM